jgi:ubiquinone/menaquinone biosynthesis C-methylase UbiE
MTDYNEIFADIDAGQVLDVATGSGYFLDLLVKGVKSYAGALGVDKKEAAEAPFKETFKDNKRVKFAVMDALHLDFADASFDTVCISNSLHHLEDPSAVLAEMLRVLRPGGRFIINEMYCDGDQAETQRTHVLLHHWMGEIDTLNNVYHRATYERGELIHFAEKMRLQDIQTFDFADLSEDPKAAEVYTELEPVIERYVQRAEGHAELQAFASTLRERLKDIGFHSATSLVLIAIK